MARAGMERWRGRSGPGEGDEVQRSLELLDRVLSEFDDLEAAAAAAAAAAAVAAATTNGETSDEKTNKSEEAESSSSSPPTVEAVDEASNVAEVARGEAAATGGTTSTTTDESPSLGHQSEDDGYMSMNGRRAKPLTLSFCLELPPPPPPEQMDLPSTPGDDYDISDGLDFPPPPEEAQRIISTLLPRVSPCNSTKRSSPLHMGRRRQLAGLGGGRAILGVDEIPPPPGRRLTSSATQTTLPKTRHQRPYGWERDLKTPSPTTATSPTLVNNLHNGMGYLGGPDFRYASLPPRTVPGAGDRHREVTRCPPADDEIADFSDDSLDDMCLSGESQPQGTPYKQQQNQQQQTKLPQIVSPQPPPSVTPKRNSIAWEVPIGEMDSLLTPGSTKVVGRRRRRSADRSSSGSVSSISRLGLGGGSSAPGGEADSWPEPPEDEEAVTSPFSETCYGSNGAISTAELDEPPPPPPPPLPPPPTNPGGTYVIRKGRRKERAPLLPDAPSIEPLKRCSSTFDNIKSLLREGLLEGLDEAPPDFQPPVPPPLVRVVSLPSLAEDYRLSRPPHELAVTVEEEEDSPGVVNADPEQFLDASVESLSGLDARVSRLRRGRAVVEDTSEWTCVSDLDQGPTPVRVVENGSLESDEIELGPLPPSPVEEIDDDDDDGGDACSELASRMSYREGGGGLEPSGSDPCGVRLRPPEPPPHHADSLTHSLKTRSMDAGFSKGSRYPSGRREPGSGERRTLPIELSGPPRRRHGHHSNCGTGNSAGGSSTLSNPPMLQTSCSLPETPVFARGSDIPRTPHRRAPEIPGSSSASSVIASGSGTTGGARTAPRPGALGPGGHGSAYRRHAGTAGGALGLGQALVGAELLRLAGGPGRGWYPRHRAHGRPASIEHLDRLAPGRGRPQPPGAPWDLRGVAMGPGDPRKPLTLPPNLSPKFFHRSPREALRRVTSLLIRKGASPKEPKKDLLSPGSAGHGESSGEQRQKKGFFKNFWKRSRHYSLEHQ